jgi:membrane protein
MQRARRTAELSVSGFLADGCPKLAAAISYYALFSLFPLAIVAVALFGLFVGDDAAREEVVDAILDNVPLREDRNELRDVLETVTAGAGAGGALGLVGLIVSASAVMGAVRFAVNTVWDVEVHRPFLRGKALDLALVAGAGLVVAASLASTLAVQILGELGPVAGFLAGQAAPAALAFAVFAALLRIVPQTRPTWRDVWPGALVAALLWAVLKAAFGWYLGNVADLGAVYASLGTVVAFLLFVWASANVFLLGAEVARHWPRVRDGEVPLEEPGGRDDDASLLERLRGAAAGLVRRPDNG